jgi:hypothetical protein
MHIGIDTPRGLTKTLLYWAFAVPFEQWDYACVLAIIQAWNVKTVNLALHMGFTEFARVEEADPRGGLVFLKMTKEQCRWLRISGASKNNVRRNERTSGTELQRTAEQLS